MPQNEFSAAIPEGREVRVVCGKHGAELLDRLIHVLFVQRGRQRVPVPLRILREEVAPPFHRDRIGTAGRTEPEEVAAGL